MEIIAITFDKFQSSFSTRPAFFSAGFALSGPSRTRRVAPGGGDGGLGIARVRLRTSISAAVIGTSAGSELAALAVVGGGLLALEERVRG